MVNDIPPRFQIKQDDKFFSRLLSKETSNSKGGESSFRVGAGGSIPFMWESQPGTPKHPFADNSIPPLTPPPSYQLSPRSKGMRGISKPNFLGSLFPRRNSRNKSDNDKLSSFSSSSSSSSSSHSSSVWNSSMLKTGSRKNSGMIRSMSVVQFGVHGDNDDDENERLEASPNSTLCFGAGIKSGGKSGSSNPTKKAVKRAFLSIGRHGMA